MAIFLPFDAFEPLEISARHTRARADFAKTQASYNAAVGALLKILGGLEARPAHSRYLAGRELTNPNF